MYLGEILVSRDKLDDIVSAAKFLQIEGAKDFILPKGQGSGQSGGGQQNNANNRMQNNVKQQQQQMMALQQQQRHNQISLLTKLVQKPPLMRPMAEQSGVSSSEQTEEHRGVKHELEDDDGDEDDEDIDQELDKSEDKSGMFNDFEENNKNNESVRHSEDSNGNDNDDEPMETQMGHMLSKVPLGTSVSTTVVTGDGHNNNGITHGLNNQATLIG